MQLYLGMSLTLFVIVLVSVSSVTHGGNVLVLPAEYSHWYNMRNIVDELLNRNHSVTVLVSTASFTVNFRQPERFQFVVFNVSLQAHELHGLSEQMIKIWLEYPRPNMVRTGLEIMDLLGKLRETHQTMCHTMLRNTELIARLKALRFDVLLYDPMIICSALLAEILDLPFVISLMGSPGFSMERMCGQMPAPPSFVPVPPSVMTDHMSFTERLKNVIVYAVYSAAFRMTSISLDNYYSQVLGK
ncbi:UDP-glucuronosyltransferase 2A2-like [Triplophysa rosa]|uniref:UDP glucuronosyltransferase 2 family polypeptide a2 short isoform n=1 Tax=Triplophysa rosa TaxID=992332 RepID=A0A9W7W7N9_TRIRA|nr:UDP-glucuronosyltransferase 2A2-like [Triplophysa rosa]KAI7789901.1 UDP glucuronosyltransferase 2 family polypeptide a2 short isoform [Triplophysa rosa]